MVQSRLKRETKAGLVAALAAALLLGACGRKGPLEPPPGNAVATQQGEQQSEPEPKRNSFFLDFLI